MLQARPHHTSIQVMVLWLFFFPVLVLCMRVSVFIPQV